MRIRSWNGSHQIGIYCQMQRPNVIPNINSLTWSKVLLVEFFQTFFLNKFLDTSNWSWECSCTPSSPSPSPSFATQVTQSWIPGTVELLLIHYCSFLDVWAEAKGAREEEGRIDEQEGKSQSHGCAALKIQLMCVLRIHIFLPQKNKLLSKKKNQFKVILVFGRQYFHLTVSC